MQGSTIKTCDAASKRSDITRIGLNNGIKIIVTSTLLLVTSIAVAGILFVPVGGRYANPDLALADVQNIGDDTVRIQTTGLTGEFSLDASDLPPEFDPPASGCKRFPFDQELELVINLSLGVVEGYTRGHIATETGTLEYRADVRGNATCFPAGGNDCGQVIVDLETRGAMAGALKDLSTNNLVGLIHMETLGSLLYQPDNAQWVSLTSNARLGGDAELISSIISMEEGESCGV